MDKIFSLVAVKSFLGQKGESNRPNGTVLPGDIVAADKARRRALIGRKLAEDAPAGKAKPLAGNKMAAGAENKEGAGPRRRRKVTTETAGPLAEAVTPPVSGRTGAAKRS